MASHSQIIQKEEVKVKVKVEVEVDQVCVWGLRLALRI